MAKAKSKKGDWIRSAVRHKGSLRRTVGAKEGEKISEDKMDEALKSKDPLTRKRAVLAKTLKKFKKGK